MTDEEMTDEQKQARRMIMSLIRGKPETHSGDAARVLLEALIHSGLTTAAVGVLDEKHVAAFQCIISDQGTLNITARDWWWGETDE